jgi:hypothetical protein
MADLEDQYLSAKTPLKVAWPLFSYGWVGFVPWNALLSNGVILTSLNTMMGQLWTSRSVVALLTSVYHALLYVKHVLGGEGERFNCEVEN